MKLGFTGTREGMTDAQKSAFGQWVYGHEIDQFHHGCCVGADTEAAHIIYEECRRRVYIVGHPPTNTSMVGEHSLALSDQLNQPLPYLDRNKRIVDACDVLIACPKEMTEEWRSGTWSTVRYGLKQGKKVLIVLPDGKVVEHEGKVNG